MHLAFDMAVVRIDLACLQKVIARLEIFCLLVSKTITLIVSLTQGQDIDHYIVEYYRDQWQLWLRYLDTHNLEIELLPSSSSSLLIQSV